MNILPTKSLIPFTPVSFFVILPQLGSQCDRCCTDTSLRWILHRCFPRTSQAKGAGKEAVASDDANGKLPEADKAVFPGSPWEPLAQPRAELTAPESFRDDPSSPHRFIF